MSERIRKLEKELDSNHPGAYSIENEADKRRRS